MTQAAATLNAHDALLPRPAGGNGAGAALAVAAHLGLLAALTFSVNWHTSSSDVVAAELWSSVPQTAAPRAEVPTPAPAPEPPPPPPPPPAPVPAPPPPPRVEAKPQEADIAIERAAKRKADEDKKRAEAEAEKERQRVIDEKKAADKKKADAAKADADKKQKEKDAREAKAEEARLDKQRQENLKRMMGQAGGEGSPTSTGTAARDAAPSAAYAGRLVSLIRRNSVFTGTVNGNPAAEVEVRTGPSGSIIARRIVKSSGFAPWDEAVLQAIDKTGTLPRDTDGRVPPVIIIKFRPYDE